MSETKQTDSQRVKDFLRNEIFKDDTEYDYDFIQQEVKKLLGDKYTPGKLSGVMTKLVESGECIRAERGIYRKNVPVKLDIERIAKEIFENAIDEIKERLKDVNIFSLSSVEFEEVKKIKELIFTIQETLNM